MFIISSVLSQKVSRPFPGYLFIILSFAACKANSENENQELMIAKTIPVRKIRSDDTGFQKHADTIYYKGKLFTGYRYSLYHNTDTAAVEGYFNGVEEGLQRRWYENGQLAEQRFYINGKKQGLHRGWWPDGKPKFEFAAHKDNYEGEFKEWYSSGLLGKQFHYKNGKEDGSQKLWWDNGTVRANYVIRNGKKYGLMGLKTCVNPYDSVIRN
jgi:antitoxin component YwqK of YwqJK toxin-antitoxin module